jgi:sterol desaturase/sphingolipid hydroxylase (fatty acid hydroxylase superfamily)
MSNAALQPRVSARLCTVIGVIATLIVVAAAVLRNRSELVGLALLAPVFLTLERLVPRVARGWWQRPGTVTDCIHFVCDEMLAAPVVLAAVWVTGWLTADVGIEWMRHVVRSQPALLMFLTACLVAEVCAYWGHWLLHHVSFLWRFHVIHHSVTKLDWLAPSRHHPLDLAVARLSVVVPLLILGFSTPSIGAPFVLRRIPGLFVHANIRLRLGRRTRWLVTTPEFHHWHHSPDPAHYDKNFAGSFPIVDWVFGTLHFGNGTAGHWPATYGTRETVPNTWWAQMLCPFRPTGGGVSSNDRLRTHKTADGSPDDATRMSAR